ncbi:MAG TPA: Ion-translocating oxidoreductase complex subunit E [Hyphomicrobiaceae bacterium MAG_BT-2024]
MVLLGAVREILGAGTLFANAPLLLGESLSFLELTVIPDYGGFLILLLPPGGFIVLGLLLALKALIDGKAVKPQLVDDSHQHTEYAFTLNTHKADRAKED